MAFAGVFPVFDMVFKIGTKGASSASTDMAEIAELESFGLSIDGTVEEWTSMTAEGWASALMTGKKFSMDLKGKRSVGDKGNDYVSALAWESGLSCSSKASIEFPDGSRLEFNCVVNTTNPGGGDSTNVAPLEFALQSNGKPTYTAAA